MSYLSKMHDAAMFVASTEAAPPARTEATLLRAELAREREAYQDLRFALDALLLGVGVAGLLMFLFR